MRDPPDAAQHHSTQRHEVGYARQHAVGVHRQRIACEIGAVAKFLEGHARQQQHRRATHFVHAVNVLHILPRIVADASLGLGDQFIPLAELGRSCRADFRAGHWLSCMYTVRTHGAFLHPRQELVPFVLGHAEGTSDHAVAAAHASVFFVDHRPGGRLAQRSHRAYRGARRLRTVHAQPPHRLVALGQHDRELMFRLNLFGRDRVRVGKLVLFGTRAFALLAADADGRVVQQRFAHDISPAAPAWRPAQKIRGRWGSNSTSEKGQTHRGEALHARHPGSSETDTGTRGGCSCPGREALRRPLSRLRTEDFGPNQALD
jgi:hypothetical protein